MTAVALLAGQVMHGDAVSKSSRDITAVNESVAALVRGMLTLFKGPTAFSAAVEMHAKMAGVPIPQLHKEGDDGASYDQAAVH